MTSNPTAGTAAFADLRDAARGWPDRAFLEAVDGPAFTYLETWQRAGQLAGALVARGARLGARISVQVEKSPEAVFLYLACLRAGAIFVPLNTAYTKAELDYFLRDAEPCLVVSRPADRDAMAALAREADPAMAVETLGADGAGTLLDLAAKMPAGFDDPVHTPDDLAAILYTSGTTGRSKGAMLTRRNLTSNALSLAEAWRFAETDVLLHALPIFHAHGLFVGINTVLVSGGRILLARAFDPDEIIRLFPRATAFMGVPTFYTRLLQHRGLNADATRHMRLFVSGSAPLLAETHREFAERTGHSILERYGMTETLMNTSNPYDGNRIPGSVGMPLPGVEIRIADPKNGRSLKTGETGAVELRGPNVFKGYWRNPQKTAEDFRSDGFFRTGDIGVVDACGYLTLIGRAKDLIITGGYNVYPMEVEAEINALPNVIESAVIGLPHQDFGEGVTAIVVKSKDADVAEDEILTALSARLARYKIPKRIFITRALPRNAIGKVQKNVLRELYADTFLRQGK